MNNRKSGAIVTTSTTNAIVTTPTLSQFNPQVDLQFIIFVNAFSTPSYINYSAFVCFAVYENKITPILSQFKTV